MARDTAPFAAALAVTLTLVALKAAAGTWGHSLAVVADAGHSLGDAGAMGLAWYADARSRRQPAAAFTFGGGRAEVLMGLANALLLWVLAGALSWQAWHSWTAGGALPGLMAAAALASLAANGLMTWAFRHPGTLNAASVARHVAADGAASLGVLLAAAVLWATGWTPVNAVATLVIAALMVWSGWGVVRDAVRVLMEAAPRELALDHLVAAMTAVEGVDEVHDLHVWTVGSQQPALACHIRIGGGGPDPDAVLCALHDVLAGYGIHHSTIQIDRAADPHPEPAW
jgi:cobalt-zinc-cadmium efflux system protein